MRTYRLALAALPLVLMSGCGGSESTAEQPKETADPEPAANATYGTVVDLRDAAELAGYECPSWEQGNPVTLAAESGSCTDEDVFATYATESARDEQASLYLDIADMVREVDMEPTPTLVGPNWTINTEDAVELQKSLGGTVSR